MRLDIVFVSLVDSHRIESVRVARNVHRRRLELCRWLVTNCESSIIVSNVLVSIVATLTEAFFKAIALVDEFRFVVS